MHYAHQPNLLAAHPHNSVAQWAAEWGVPVTVIAFGTVAALLARAAKQVLHATTVSNTTIVLAVAGLATLAGVIDSLVSGTLVMPVSETWWFIAFGCMLACSRTAPSTIPLAGGALRWTLVSALLASHAGLSVVTYERSVKPPQSASNDGPQRTNVPRYWINGFF